LDEDWHYAVGNTDATISVHCRRNGDIYTAEITYTIIDYYDWDKDDYESAGIVAPAWLYELHRVGMAREYRSIGKTEPIKITWQKGTLFMSRQKKIIKKIIIVVAMVLGICWGAGHIFLWRTLEKRSFTPKEQTKILSIIGFDDCPGIVVTRMIYYNAPDSMFKVELGGIGSEQVISHGFKKIDEENYRSVYDEDKRFYHDDDVYIYIDEGWNKELFKMFPLWQKFLYA